jgi:hypothetical protein
MLEYLNTIYCLPLISTIIGITILYLYDKFEKKQYTNAIYLRIALLIYISSFATFYLSNNSNLFGIMSMQSGGGSIDPQSMMPQANDLKLHLEQFKTGVPTF